jgi:N-acetylmuramoyl-L-alanine amidase
MKDLTVALIPSHGMFTPGKRSPEIPPGEKEWMLSRMICSSIEVAYNDFYSDYPIEIINTNPGPIAIKETKTIEFVNKLYRDRKKKVVSIAIHTNAHNRKGWGNANGYKIWLGNNASERSFFIAKTLDNSLRPNLDYPIRSRGISQNGLWINTRMRCPSMLFEAGFHTNKKEVEKLRSYYNRQALADSIITTLEHYRSNHV